jgi:hypothetical protein
VAQIKDTLSRFVAWSHDHAGARCPDAAALGAALDPWGQPLQIVCSDQPADQLAGILSFGPDRTPGTHDDVVSWTLGAEVADLVRGPRWSASRGTASTSKGARRVGEPARAAATGPMPAVAAPPPPPVAASPAPSPDRGEPVVPTSRTAPAARPPASPGAGSDDTDGDGIPDRR